MAWSEADRNAAMKRRTLDDVLMLLFVLATAALMFASALKGVQR